MQPVLLRPQIDGFSPVSVANANELVTRWGHGLGPCHRPFGMDAWTFDVCGEPVAVAISASTVSDHVSGSIVDVTWRRDEVVELARLCSSNQWANRIMLRWWREVGALRWPYWPIKAAVSYSDRGKQGSLYRFDGWRLINDNCGDWRTRSTRRSTHASRFDGKSGGKRLWDWTYTGGAR